MSLSKLFGKIPPVPWRLAHLAEIPALGPAAEREYWRLWTDDPAFGRNWRSVRRHFGIEGFGANANEAEAGELLVVPHAGDDHAGQEEIYVLLRGRARFTCDGDLVDVGEGDVLYVPPEVKREARALETPTRIFMVGGTPGEPYRPN